MNTLEFTSKMNEVNERVTKGEQILGASLLQPFANTNSGSRKLMHTTHRNQAFVLINPEKAIVETGYEMKYGKYSSSIVEAEDDFTIVDIIPKFSFAPRHIYSTIVINEKNKSIDIIKRIPYKHITESYGYLNNNNKLDSYNVGDRIQKNTRLSTSTAFDEYGNRKDGVNLNTVYMGIGWNTDDSILISDTGRRKMDAPLIKPISIMINENDIPLNLYGNTNMYKVIPDIGENVREDGILLALRQEKKEASLYMQAINKLEEIVMSDNKYITNGTVIDVNIYCNNVANLDNIYNGQFKMYYGELQRYSERLINIVTEYVINGYTLSYELQKDMALAKSTINNIPYLDRTNKFSNIKLEVTILERLPVNIGDKLTNRFGGKGVVSKILDDRLMPRLEDGTVVDIILNSASVYNRENIGQAFELSITHTSRHIIKYIKDLSLSSKSYIEESLDVLYRYLDICAPSQSKYLKETMKSRSPEEIEWYIQRIIKDNKLDISNDPMSESMTIAKLQQIYKEFPFIKQDTLYVPISDSNGNLRYMKARRNVVVGKQYMLRLKQFPADKFSAASSSSTNIKNENIKSRAKKDHRRRYSNTPIQAGNMEMNELSHMGDEYVLTNAMIQSLSPIGRRNIEILSTQDNPFEINVLLDYKAINRAAEMLNVYLKAMGFRFKFTKVYKPKHTVLLTPFTLLKKPDGGYTIKNDDGTVSPFLLAPFSMLPKQN